MITRIKNIIKAVTTRLSFLPILPGQGVFGSEKSDEMDFTVTLYKTDIERVQSKSDAEFAADELIDEYVDCIQNQLTMALEKTKRSGQDLKSTDMERLYGRLAGKSDIVVGENVGAFMSGLKKFKPAKKKQTGKIRCIGTLDRAKVYVNSYVRRGEVYVIDRSVIDVRCDVSPGEDRIDLKVKTRVNNEGVTKYSFTF